MSRQHLHTEENFWPSVSDMFLTLFVIALVLYSTADKDRGRGDLFIQQVMLEEACDFVEALQQARPGDATVHSVNVGNLRKETAPNDMHAEFAACLVDMMSFGSAWERYFAVSVEDRQRMDEARKNYRIAVDIAYQSCCGEESGEPEKNPALKLRKIRRKLVAATMKEHREDSVENLKARLREANGKIAAYEGKIQKLEELLKAQDADGLQKLVRQYQAEINSLKAGQEKQKERLKELKNRLASMGSENSALRGANAKLKEQLNQDMRSVVMDDVARVLKAYSVEGKVTIEKELGVIRIPSSSVGFESGVYKRFSGTETLRSIAAALRKVAKENQESKRIDNIVIECHADTDGEAFYNEELSSNRALYIWKFLNEATWYELEKFQNSSGLGLFSHAGFGERVPVKRIPGENEEAFKARCRRIDIRFNCTPVKGEASLQ